MESTKLKNLFLLDGLGAILSAFLLGIVLVKLESYFGIPKKALYILAALPCLFMIYDFFCYYKIERNLAKYLKGIAIVNLLYCCLSIGMAIYHQEVISSLGWIYLIVEIIVVMILAIIELKVANKFNLEISTNKHKKRKSSL